MAAPDGLATAGRETRHEPAPRHDPALPSGITLELVDSRQTANLARREADMALRHQPPESSDFYTSKGRDLRLCGLPASRRGHGCVGHLYRRASTLCAGALGPAAGRRGGNAGGAARLVDADAFGRDPRRYRPWRIALLCRRRPSPARAADPADPRNRGRIRGCGLNPYLWAL